MSYFTTAYCNRSAIVIEQSYSRCLLCIHSTAVNRHLTGTIVVDRVCSAAGSRIVQCTAVNSQCPFIADKIAGIAAWICFTVYPRRVRNVLHPARAAGAVSDRQLALIQNQS